MHTICCLMVATCFGWLGSTERLRQWMPGALFTGLAVPCATGAGASTSGFALGGVGGSSDGGGLDEHHKINSHGSHGGCRICRNHCCAGNFRAGVFMIARVDLNNRFRNIFRMRQDPWWRTYLRYMLRTMRQNKTIIDALISGRIVCK